MHNAHVTPKATDELARLHAQHAVDVAALELAADIIACQDARIIQLEADQAGLILQARRDLH